jgi:hypothetical protein
MEVLQRPVLRAEDVHEVECLELQLAERGFAVIKDVYTTTQIAAFRRQHDALFAEVQRQMVAVEPVIQSYVNKFGAVESESQLPFFGLNDGSVAIQLAEGRYDFTYGMDRGARWHRPVCAIYACMALRQARGEGEVFDLLNSLLTGRVLRW